MRYIKYFSLLVFALLTSCLKEEALVANADFTLVETVVPNGKKIKILNLSANAEQYSWTFENGIPATSNVFNPGEILFAVPGTHTIKLLVSNKDGSQSETTKTIIVLGPASTDFGFEILVNNYAPVEVKITNLSQNVAQNNWTFSNGIPAFSSIQNPSNVIFNTAGQNSINLQTNQGQKTVTFDVLPTLNVAFDINVLPIDDNYTAPLKIKLQNNTISATSYLWEIVGTNISNSTLENPEFYFPNSGNYQVKLTATNGKQTLSLIKNISVLPNTNLSIQNNVKFGINSAHTSIGSFYSTINKESYKSTTVNNTNGTNIDIAFFGLSNAFSNNIFVSPNNVGIYGFQNIANATNTIFNNKQESCNCPTISVSQFDAMTNDNLLQNYAVVIQNDNFNNVVSPRVIPFMTQDGRKGLIKIKSYVDNGADSYILTDIKVQKH